MEISENDSNLKKDGKTFHRLARIPFSGHKARTSQWQARTSDCVTSRRQTAKRFTHELNTAAKHLPVHRRVALQLVSLQVRVMAGGDVVMRQRLRHVLLGNTFEGSPEQHVKAHENHVGDAVEPAANARPLEGRTPLQGLKTRAKTRTTHLIPAVVSNRCVPRYRLVWFRRLRTSVTSNRLNSISDQPTWIE